MKDEANDGVEHRAPSMEGLTPKYVLSRNHIRKHVRQQQISIKGMQFIIK